MSNYKEHLVKGLILELVVLVALFVVDVFVVNLFDISWSLLNVFYLLLILYFAPLLPDIDHRSSNVTWQLVIIGLVLNVVGLWLHLPVMFLGLCITVITVGCAFFAKHRGITHNPFFGLFLIVVIGLVTNLLFAWIFAVGYGSHLVLDKVWRKAK